jgi:hypothetical protein
MYRWRTYKEYPKSNTITEIQIQGSFGFKTLVSLISSPKQWILFFASFFYIL